MRSELIFRARETVDNKYKLCQTASKATRRLHIAATNTTDTINDAFSRIAGGDDSSIAAIPFLRRRSEHSQGNLHPYPPGVNYSWPQNARIERMVSSLLVSTPRLQPFIALLQTSIT